MENTPKYRCIIVDDEPIARKIIGAYVAQIAFLENAGECKNALEALEIISGDSSIQIAFLDINMPHLSGLAMANIVKKDIKIIFTTAYSEYAVASYEVNAIDYLVKPFSFERFAVAVFKAIDSIKLATNPSKEIIPQDKTIYIKSEGMSYPVLLSDIQYCEAMKNYTKVILSSGKVLKPLAAFSKMEQDLLKESDDFLRVHRSFLVSKKHIMAVKNTTVMVGKAEVPVGLQFREAFLQSIGKK
ncbi:MAG TPA: LytTR family DNA-binding domain-containing protein [Flavobacterium sp.]|nr:LytTR family DNA-binding domain-containing protein [Flavobacterium sp.]